MRLAIYESSRSSFSQPTSSVPVAGPVRGVSIASPKDRNSVGLLGLLDDVAALAKVAAASMDDVTGMAMKAGLKIHDASGSAGAAFGGAVGWVVAGAIAIPVVGHVISPLWTAVKKVLPGAKPLKA